MRVPHTDPAWLLSVAWVLGFPITVWLGGLVWSAVNCGEQAAVCRGGMQWFGFIGWGGIAWFVGIVAIAVVVAVTNRRPRPGR